MKFKRIAGGNYAPFDRAIIDSFLHTVLVEHGFSYVASRGKVSHDMPDTRIAIY